jgi:hypothetical protein
MVKRKGKREAAKIVFLNDERRRLAVFCAACGMER